MNDVPRNDAASDDLDDLYRRTVASDSSRPSENVREAILLHAAQQATAQPATSQRAIAQHGTRSGLSGKTRRFVPKRLSAAVGTLAAAVLVGMIVIPHYMTPHYQTPPLAAPASPRASIAPSERVTANAQARAAAAPPSKPMTPFAGAVPSAAMSAPLNEITVTQSLALRAAPDSPVSGAALRRAAEQGNIPKLQTLLQRGADVNARDADDRTALLLAVLNSRSDVVDLLITHGADVNAADRGGNTPLHAAESMRLTTIAAALRAAGAH